MSFRLVEKGWTQVLTASLGADSSYLRIVSPFIKRKAAEQLLAARKPASINVITRFNLNDFAAGVSDISALRLLLGHGATIRGVKNLHAKLYVFGDSSAVVTSANLTLAALHRNHEFGFVASEPQIVCECRSYFDNLWKRGGANLLVDQLDQWESRIRNFLARRGNKLGQPALPDEGANAGFEPEEVAVSDTVMDPPQAFVKFFGWSQNRVSRSYSIQSLLQSSGAHWACTYPRGKRPRQVCDGALMFLSRLTNDHDIVIFGRAIGMEYVEGRDDASAADIAQRPWKERWPHYVRVHSAEIVAGELGNGVSLNELMATMGVMAFAATKKRFEEDPETAINLSGAYARKPAVRLTPQATTWLNDRLQRSFDVYGRVPPADLSRLD